MLLQYNKLSRYNNQALQEHKMKLKPNESVYITTGDSYKLIHN